MSSSTVPAASAQQTEAAMSDREDASGNAAGAAPGEGDGVADADVAAGRTIDQMRGEIDVIDAELVRLIQRRTALSRAIGAARASEGGTRIVYRREMKILDRFSVLGPAGSELGMLLLSLGRGKLGRR
jgi:chorismate mutase